LKNYINKYTLLLVVFILFFLFIEIVLKHQVENFAIYENSQKLDNILINQKALHTYVEEIQKPVIYKLKKEGKLYHDFFNPKILSFTYIARNIHKIENNLLKNSNKNEKYYKLVSNNPRNSLNIANEFERNLIKKFNEKKLQEYKDVITENGKKFLYYASPVTANKKSCMRCHSSPDIAPKELLKIYGTKNGFYEKIGERRAIISIKIPLEKELIHAKKYYNIISLIIFISLIFIYIIIFFLIRKLDIKQEKLQELANIDQLTQCYNRRVFELDSQHEIELAKRINQNFSLISFDIDYFKNINDTYGHQEGDKVLINISTIVKQTNRKYDKLYRVGGEEFMILLPSTNLENAVKIAQRIRLDIQKYSLENKVITASFGVCEYNKEDNLTELYKKVDDILYKAKENGRNRVESC